jgi:Putative lipoprotein
MNSLKATAVLPQASGDQLRLYAMGHDAGSLINQLSELRQNPDMTMNGLTGVIHVTTDGVIIRDLIWTRYNNGQLSNEPAATQPAIPQPVQ